MATSWADIISAAMIQIDDIRLREQMSESPAQFYRRMAEVLKQALPLMSRPPELLDYLQSEKESPLYADYSWTSTEESTTQETVLATELVGYDICSCVMRIPQDNGTVALYPISVTYDEETGNVTIPVQSEAGFDYDIDFYKDGSFDTLTDSQMRLFALAIAVVWDERFSRNWLNMQMKEHDQSFDTVNEGNYTEKITKRLKDNRVSFNDELRAYEQQVAFKTVFANSTNSVNFV